MLSLIILTNLEYKGSRIHLMRILMCVFIFTPQHKQKCLSCLHWTYIPKILQYLFILVYNTYVTCFSSLFSILSIYFSTNFFSHRTRCIQIWPCFSFWYPSQLKHIILLCMKISFQVLQSCILLFTNGCCHTNFKQIYIDF